MNVRFLFTIGLTTVAMFGGYCQSARAVIISALTSSALTGANSIVTFDSASPGTITNTVPISGITLGDVLSGIDYRPIDQQLVGLGYNSATGFARVYSISASGAATSVNANTLNFGIGLNRITADFNPTANALRVVTSAADRNNLRITAAGTGMLADDTNLNPTNAGIRATAYSRNSAGGGTSGATTLYEIDGANNTLATQGSIDFFTGSGTSPNSGTLTSIFGLGVNASTIVGFDIFNAPGTAATSPGTAFIATSSTLFSLNLTNGVTASLGTIGTGLTIVDIAAVPEPSSLAFASLVIAGLVVGYRRRKNRFGAVETNKL